MSLIPLSGYHNQSPAIETSPVEGVLRRPAVGEEASRGQDSSTVLMKQRPTPMRRPYTAETPGQPRCGGAFYATSGTSAEIIPAEFYHRGVIINTWI